MQSLARQPRDERPLSGPRPSADSDTLGDCHKHLVVVLPARNEEATVGPVVANVPTTLDGIRRVDVIVVDDGSSDGTAETARAAGARVIPTDGTPALGTAFSTGIAAALAAGADVIVNMDADGQFDPRDIPALIRPILAGSCGFVTCTRFWPGSDTSSMPRIKRWGNRWMCLLVNRLIKGSFTDVSCGFRAYSRDAALKLNLFGTYTYTQEAFLDLANKNVRMTEVPLRVRSTREFGESRVARHVLYYALQTAWILVCTLRDTRPIRFFGTLALLFLLPGIFQTAFVAYWWLATGRSSPFTSMVTTGAACLMLGTLIGVLALLADQLGRVRRIQEEILFLEKKRLFDATAEPRNGGNSDTD